jgi:hypothetical protein
MLVPLEYDDSFAGGDRDLLKKGPVNPRYQLGQLEDFFQHYQLLAEGCPQPVHRRHGMRRVKMCQANFLRFFFGSARQNRPSGKRLIHNSFAATGRRVAFESDPSEALLG